MSETKDILQLKFDGNGINPDKVLPSEICDLVYEFQNALLCTIKESHPEIDTQAVLFSFDSIKNESLGINFKAIEEHVLPEIKNVVVASYILIATSINTQDYSSLNQDAIGSLKKIVGFSKKYQCNGQLNRNGETLTTITPNTEIKDKKTISIKSNLTIYGEIVEVGNNVHLRLNEGYNVYIDVDKTVSKKLATKLWEFVGIKGIGKWDTNTLKITEFKYLDILDYSPGNISRTFSELREV